MGETFEQFCQQHGGRRIVAGGRLLFADGASCDPEGLFRLEPPADDRLRRGRRRDYHRAMAAAAPSTPPASAAP